MRSIRLEVTSGAAIFYPLWYFLDNSGWFSAAIPAIVCHELGHWAAVSLWGLKVLSLRLEIFGLCMETTPFTHRQEEIICLAAGPAAGLLWAGVAGIMKSTWTSRTAAISLALSLFNLLPALPLDGGRILLTATGRRNLVRACSIVTAVILAWIAVLGHIWAFVPAVLIAAAAVTA